MEPEPVVTIKSAEEGVAIHVSRQKSLRKVCMPLGLLLLQSMLLLLLPPQGVLAGSYVMRLSRKVASEAAAQSQLNEDALPFSGWFEGLSTFAGNKSV